MQVEYRLKLGSDEVVLRFDAQSEKEVFERLSFFSNIPKTGPNNEQDLKLSFKKTREGDTYYSVISESAGMEYKYGQKKADGLLFPKGWEKLYKREETEEGTTTPVVGAPTQVAPKAVVKAAVVATAAPEVVDEEPTPTPVVRRSTAAPAVGAVAAVAPRPAPAIGAQSQTQVNNILAKYGVGPK